MDRFIEQAEQMLKKQELCLKSNMDRFIVFTILLIKSNFYRLKSNMDRFIGFYVSDHNFKNAV